MEGSGGVKQSEGLQLVLELLLKAVGAWARKGLLAGENNVLLYITFLRMNLVLTCKSHE